MNIPAKTRFSYRTLHYAPFHAELAASAPAKPNLHARQALQAQSHAPRSAAIASPEGKYCKRFAWPLRCRTFKPHRDPMGIRKYGVLRCKTDSRMLNDWHTCLLNSIYIIYSYIYIYVCIVFLLSFLCVLLPATAASNSYSSRARQAIIIHWAQGMGSCMPNILYICKSDFWQSHQTDQTFRCLSSIRCVTGELIFQL